MSADCGCCGRPGCGGSAGAAGLANRPGLDQLSYRAGTHGSFLAAMLARLTTGPSAEALAGLAARSGDDPAIALLDAWATVADVLTFYQERIANEGYLRTATERRSVLELAGLIGYRSRPGVAASTYLAFTVERDQLSAQETAVVVPPGSRAQSVPGPGEMPQSFETSRELAARASWSVLRPRLTRPSTITPESLEQLEALYFEGVLTGLAPNDRLLFDFGALQRVLRVKAVTPDGMANVTRVTLQRDETAAYRALLVALLAQVEAWRAPANVASSARAREIDSQVLAELQGALERERAALARRGVPRAATLAAALRDGLARLRGELAFVRARGFRNLIAWLEPIVAGLESALPTLERLAAPAATPAPALAPTGGSLLGLIGAQLGALRKPPTRPPASSRDLRRSVATLLAPGSDFALQLLGELNGSIGGRLPAALAATEAAPSALGEVAALRVKAAPFGASAPQRPIFDSRGAVVGSEEWPLASATVRVVVGPSGDGPARIRVTVAVRRRGVEASQAFVLDPNAEAEVALGDVSGQVSHVGDGLGLRLNVRLPDADDRTRSYEIVHHGDVLLVTVDGHQLRLTIGQTVRTAVGERRIAVDAVSPAEDGALPTATLADEGPAAVDPLLLPLDGPYDRIVAGGWVLIESAGGGEPTIARALEVATLARADYAMSARVTQLTLDRRWVDPQAERTLAAARQRTVYAQSEPLTLAWEPIEEEVAGDTIELDAVYSGLGSGRWLIVAGERTDVPGGSRVPASELVMLADVQQGPDPMPAGDKPRTTLRLATPLAYRYRRATLKIWGNVVAATHGETREEVLGSASAGRAWQSFALSQAPLTHLAAANPLGAESTLEVRVDGVRWAEASSPLWLGPTDRGYVTRVDEREGVTVVFGDGRHGARPASGVENVRAVYRTGLGKRGNVRAEQISQLQSRPLGVSAVVNPLPATGGADPESRDEVRRNAPLVLGALDRLVSVADHEHFARARAGIGKASARRLSDGRRTVVHLTIAGAADVPIAPSSALLRSLREALLRSGDPHLPVVVAVRELALLLIRARVSVEAGYLWANVEPAVRAALLATFSFERRELGRDVLLAEVIAAIQSVPGVSYVDVETLAKVPESASPAELAALAQTLPPRPAPRLIAELARFEEQSHAVLAGETLAGIAGQHGLDLDELLRLNPELASATPAAGTELIVRRGLRPAQLLLLTPALADTLLLEEIGP